MRAESKVRRRERCSLSVIVLCVAVLVLLGCLLATVLAFALAWPQFEELWNDALASRAAEDSYTTNWWTVVPPALCALPFAVLAVATGSAVVHTAAAVRVTAGEQHQGLSARQVWRRLRPRAGKVLVLYVLRGVILLTATLVTGAACVGVGYALDAFTGLRPFGAGGPFGTTAGLVSMLLPVPLVLRLGFALAPAAVAVDGTTAWAALRRSWVLVWRRRVWPRFLAAGAPATCVLVAVWLSVRHAVALLRPTVREAVLDHVTTNEYVAGTVATTVPMMTLLLLCAAAVLCPVQMWLSSIYLRLR